MVIHGGCWRAYWQLDLMDELCRDLAERGIAAWNIEYRRLGQGGGWPMSLIDVGAATDILPLLSARHALDLSRLIRPRRTICLTATRTPRPPSSCRSAFPRCWCMGARTKTSTHRSPTGMRSAPEQRETT
jgi:hypothetical protein